MAFDIMNVKQEPPIRDFNQYKITVYGTGGIGKTSLCGFLFDDSAFWQFEKGQNALKAKKVPVPNWKTVQTYVKQLVKAHKEGSKMPFSVAVWDTVDIASKLCQDWVCEQNGWGSPNDAGYGQGWNVVKNEWDMTIKALNDIGIAVVFIAHDNDKEFTRKDGTKYNQIIPSASKTFLGAVYDQVDFVIYCDKVETTNTDGTKIEKRMMHFRETSEYKAKSHLMYMPDCIEFADTPKETAERVKKAFEEACDKEFNGVDTKIENEKHIDTIETSNESIETGYNGKEDVKIGHLLVDMLAKEEKNEEKPKKARKKRDSDDDEVDKSKDNLPWEDENATHEADKKEIEEVTKVSNTTEDISLDELKKITQDMAMGYYKSGKLTIAELNQAFKEYGNSDKISTIKNIDDCWKLHGYLVSR